MDSIELIPTNGWTALAHNSNSFRDNTDQKGRNLVIFDADAERNNGGFTRRLNAIKAIKQTENIEFDLFLFPNNNDDGDLETLLSLIVCEQHQGVMECFNTYEVCLRGQVSPNPDIRYNMPLTKTKIFAYMETLLNGKILKVARDNNHWFFESADYWNLNSDQLNPLRTFFINNLGE